MMNNAVQDRPQAAAVIGSGASARKTRLCNSHQLIFDVLDARRADSGSKDDDDDDAKADELMQKMQKQGQEMLERLPAPRRFDRAWISGRISERKALGVVLESHTKRHDAHTRQINSSKVRATYLPRLDGVRGPSVIAAGADAAHGECY